MFGQPDNPDIKVEIHLEDDVFGPSFAAFLFFDWNSAELKQAHKDWLSPKAVAFLQNNIGWSEIYAYTDSTGTDQVNIEFSRQRLLAVQTFLSQNGVAMDKAFDPVNHKYFGEQFAREHGADSTKNPDFRVVCIGLWKDIFKVRSPVFWRYRSFTFGRTH